MNRAHFRSKQTLLGVGGDIRRLTDQRCYRLRLADIIYILSRFHYHFFVFTPY